MQTLPYKLMYDTGGGSEGEGGEQVGHAPCWLSNVTVFCLSFPHEVGRQAVFLSSDMDPMAQTIKILEAELWEQPETRGVGISCRITSSFHFILFCFLS